MGSKSAVKKRRPSQSQTPILFLVGHTADDQIGPFQSALTLQFLSQFRVDLGLLFKRSALLENVNNQSRLCAGILDWSLPQ